MLKEIKLSEGFMQKLVEAQFNAVEVRSWVRSYITWLIDSKFRTYKRLDSFLKEQLDNPSKELRSCVKEIKGKNSPNYDELIINILKFVKGIIVYQDDVITYGTEEYWATAGNVLKQGRDDCDGINSLIYLIARECNIPSYLIWCCIGEAGGVGHLWTLYYSLEKRKLYAIDGTYNIDLNPINLRIPFVLSNTRYQKIWYIFNENFIYKLRG